MRTLLFKNLSKNSSSSSSSQRHSSFIRFFSKTKTKTNSEAVVEETSTHTLKRDGSVGPISSARYTFFKKNHPSISDFLTLTPNRAFIEYAKSRTIAIPRSVPRIGWRSTRILRFVRLLKERSKRQDVWIVVLHFVRPILDVR